MSESPDATEVTRLSNRKTSKMMLQEENDRLIRQARIRFSQGDQPTVADDTTILAPNLIHILSMLL